MNDTLGLEGMLGKNVFMMCANYFYTGTITAVSDKYVGLQNAGIVYETGPWTNKSFKDLQSVEMGDFWVMRAAIESFGSTDKPIG